MSNAFNAFELLKQEGQLPRHGKRGGAKGAKSTPPTSEAGSAPRGGQTPPPGHTMDARIKNLDQVVGEIETLAKDTSTEGRIRLWREWTREVGPWASQRASSAFLNKREGEI